MMSVPSRPMVRRDELVGMLASAVGEAPVQAAVDRACEALALPADRWTVADALKILEHLAESPGLLGITARFVKTRAILSWGRR